MEKQVTANSNTNDLLTVTAHVRVGYKGGGGHCKA